MLIMIITAQIAALIELLLLIALLANALFVKSFVLVLPAVIVGVFFLVILSRLNHSEASDTGHHGGRGHSQYGNCNCGQFCI
jgi:hypothetical protein